MIKRLVALLPVAVFICCQNPQEPPLTADIHIRMKKPATGEITSGKALLEEKLSGTSVSSEIDLEIGPENITGSFYNISAGQKNIRVELFEDLSRKYWGLSEFKIEKDEKKELSVALLPIERLPIDTTCYSSGIEIYTYYNTELESNCYAVEWLPLDSSRFYKEKYFYHIVMDTIPVDRNFSYYQDNQKIIFTEFSDFSRDSYETGIKTDTERRYFKLFLESILNNYTKESCGIGARVN
ncbi:MAG: hypothetical protein ACLFQK_06645 [Fibrobacterota bacterium]